MSRRNKKSRGAKRSGFKTFWVKALWRLRQGSSLRERENGLRKRGRTKGTLVPILVDGDQACWSVSAKISEYINMPPRQAEYNPSYIRSSIQQRPRRLRKNAEYRPRFPLNYIKNVLSRRLILLWRTSIKHKTFYLDFARLYPKSYNCSHCVPEYYELSSARLSTTKIEKKS